MDLNMKEKYVLTAGPTFKSRIHQYLIEYYNGVYNKQNNYNFETLNNSMVSES